MDKSLNQSTYNRLKKDILSFALKPGDSVSAAKLAERYNVSRTPAREALVKLEAEGMVNIFPQSKTLISKINVHRVRQEWFVRKALELTMVDPFFAKVNAHDVELMRMYNNELVKMMEQPQSSELSYECLSYDNDFHAVSYMVTGERVAATLIYRATAHYNRLRMLIDREQECKNRTLADHEALIECVERNEKEKYRKILEDHLTHIVTDLDRMREQYPDYFEG